MIIDLLHEESEVVLIEELDSIKKILDPKTPIIWLKEILRLELWEEELFQGGDVTLPSGHHYQIPEVIIRVW